jgi:hypothetical protein
MTVDDFARRLADPNYRRWLHSHIRQDSLSPQLEVWLWQVAYGDPPVHLVRSPVAHPGPLKFTALNLERLNAWCRRRREDDRWTTAPRLQLVKGGPQ